MVDSSRVYRQLPSTHYHLYLRPSFKTNIGHARQRPATRESRTVSSDPQYRTSTRKFRGDGKRTDG